MSGHSFNELLHFKTESANIGLTPRILVPRATDERLAAEIGADRVLELLPAFEVNAENLVLSTVTFADTGRLSAPFRKVRYLTQASRGVTPLTSPAPRP